jgi:alpha-tubulin suppressor-like RCC1 family protein
MTLRHGFSRRGADVKIAAGTRACGWARAALRRWILAGVLACVALAAPATALATPATAISAGYDHTCALTSAGAVMCWGDNELGQLGDGTETSTTTPVDVIGLSSGVAAISAGGGHTCALTSAGAVKCWGNNGQGQLGDGTTGNTTEPVDVIGLSSGVTAISAGVYDTCALTSAGAVKCWGYNAYGELGDGTTTNSSEPVAVSGLSSGVTAISAGFFHTCALTSAGAVKCWGWGDSGALGDGTTANQTTQVAVSGLSSGVTAISAGQGHTCALTSAGAVECWGANLEGQLGDGTTKATTEPVAVSGMSSGIAAISAGGFHTCALTSTGAVECWGYNKFGQLGDGTTKNKTTPVDALGFLSGTCASNSGTITLSPGLTATPAVQKVKVKGTLSGCTGGPFTGATYTATMETGGPVSCSVLDGEPALVVGSAKFKWTPNAKASTGALALLLAETDESAMAGEVLAGSYAPLTFSEDEMTEEFSGGEKCGEPEGKKAAKAVKTGDFRGSAIDFE